MIIGDSQAGKSSILNWLVHRRFNINESMTIGVEYGDKLINIANKAIKLQIWDSSGQEGFRHIIRAYFKMASVFILVYDVTRRRSFEKLNNWVKEIRDLNQEKILIFLVGNKIDLDLNRTVSFEEGQQFAIDNNLLYAEVSAKTGLNIDQIFYISAFGILSKIMNHTIDPYNHSGIKVPVATF